MNTLIKISLNDLKNAFRDRVMSIFVFLPVLMVMVMKWLYPYLGSMFPVIFNYEAEFVALLTMVGAMGPAFLVSLLILDENDENITSALRIIPIVPYKFMFARVLFIFGLSVLGSAFLIFFSGIELDSILRVFVLSFLIGLISPLITLICISIARNKIEGITLMKGLNFFLAIPFILILLKPSWEYLGGIIPFFWPYKAFQTLYTSEFWFYVTGGILYLAGLIFVFFRIMIKKYQRGY